jgi:long-chain fatty acid transport protein
MKWLKLPITLAIIGLTAQAQASDFSLPFVNAAGLGTAYSDWATGAEDASTSYTNPAGLIKIQHQQLVVAPLGILGNTRFTGSTLAPTIPFPVAVAQNGGASSRIGAFLPSFYYSIPINNRFTFGVHQTTPFGLGTTYDKTSLVRYLSTRSQVVAIDIGPSIGFKANDKLSLGLGLDAERLAFTLNSMFSPLLAIPDAESQNHLSGWGFGWHGGVLYEPMPATRIGVSFNSMVMIHTTGDSEAYTASGLSFRTTNQKTNAALPARAQFSMQQALNDKITVMGTAFYTNWHTFDKINMKRVMTPFGSTTFVSIPFNYHNTFDYSIGMTYKPTQQWLLRTGMQFMNSPSNKQNRGVADPIGSATILAVGAHYQQNEKFGYDLSYGHSFFKDQTVNNITPLSSAVGQTQTQTNVIGAQFTWNIVE